MPQIRGDLSHPESYLLAKAFGIEVVLDSRPPKGSLRRVANGMDIAAVTYEGGEANQLDQVAVKVAVAGCLNVLKSLKVIPKIPADQDSGSMPEVQRGCVLVKEVFWICLLDQAVL